MVSLQGNWAGVSLLVLLRVHSFHSPLVAGEDPLVNCTLCIDPNALLGNPGAILTTGEEVLSCQDIYDRGVLSLPEKNCTALQTFGDKLCLCDQEIPEINNCTLCEDGSRLKEPLLEGLPGEICAALQVDASRDDPDKCGAYQATLGVYCLCDNPIAAANACRFCGDAQLPNQLQIVNGTDKSCGKLELEATIETSMCSSFQGLYGEECCRDLPHPTMTPVTSGVLVPKMIPVALPTIVIMFDLWYL